MRKVETSLTIRPPTSIRSNAASTSAQVVREQARLQAELAACRRGRVASSGSLKRVERRPPARTAPRTIDLHARRRRRRASVGWKTRPSRSPPASTLAPRGDGLAQPLLDALGVAGADQRADVGRLVERVADHERARSAAHEVVLEPVERLVVT